MAIYFDRFLVVFNIIFSLFIMLKPTDPHSSYQRNLFHSELLSQLDTKDPLIKLSRVIDWSVFEEAFSPLYCHHNGRPAKPIRLMVGLLMLKSLENLSDETLVLQFKRNPYYQYFCGYATYEPKEPCEASELCHFRKRIGVEGVNRIFQASVHLHGKRSNESTVLIDTTVQEKNITYPTDAKLAIQIIKRLNKLAKAEGIQQRRTYIKEVKESRLQLRHFRHVKKRAKARKALKHLRTLANRLIRELQRELPQWKLFETYQKDFLFYQRVLAQKKQDKNKIYSLHEPTVLALAKGKDHTPYEYGNKVSICATLKEQIIVGVQSHKENIHDSKTLKDVLGHAHQNCQKPIKIAVCDRGYRGVKQIEHTKILLPSPPLKRDSQYLREKKRKLCRKRAAIEPIIGHLKNDFRLARNYLKGVTGDEINVLMAACAWNLKKWMRFFYAYCLVGTLSNHQNKNHSIKKAITFIGYLLRTSNRQFGQRVFMVRMGF